MNNTIDYIMSDYMLQVLSNMHIDFQILGWVFLGISIAGYWMYMPIVKFDAIDDPDGGESRIKRFGRILLCILITGVILLIGSIFCPSL